MAQKGFNTLVCPNPECFLTPKFTLSNIDWKFNSICLSNHTYNENEINKYLTSSNNEINFECPCKKEKSQYYTYFCTKCNKNICSNCYDEHSDHDNENIIIDLNRLKPKPKEYEDI